MGRAGCVTQGAWQQGLAVAEAQGTRRRGALHSQQQEHCSLPPAAAEASTARPWSQPPIVPQPLTPTSCVQGYKMDDLLTSYVQQLLSTVNKQRGSQAPALAEL